MTEAPAPSDMREHPDPPPTRWRYLLYVGGVAMIVVGLKGILHNDHHWEQPSFWWRLLLGPAVAHDLVFAPLVAVGGTALARVVPARYRPPIQLGVFASFVLTLFAWPGLRQYASAKDNPSVSPLNYAHGLLICIGVVWLVVSLEVLRRAWRARRPPHAEPSE